VRKKNLVALDSLRRAFAAHVVRAQSHTLIGMGQGGCYDHESCTAHCVVRACVGMFTALLVWWVGVNDKMRAHIFSCDSFKQIVAAQ
jgi:hypothetical protein